LTSEDLAAIAVKAGLCDEQKVESITAWSHNENLIRSFFAQMTMDICWEMWGRGELEMRCDEYRRSTGAPSEQMRPLVEAWYEQRRQR